LQKSEKYNIIVCKGFLGGVYMKIFISDSFSAECYFLSIADLLRGKETERMVK